MRTSRGGNAILIRKFCTIRTTSTEADAKTNLASKHLLLLLPEIYLFHTTLLVKKQEMCNCNSSHLVHPFLHLYLS